ncbi:exocyst complex component Sec5-domain-containing protein [Zychaea mexicana]|uniref:exocyst complex component Sec5-domain-containing protein n=1 Tax=Zychaea mexicana TaxID=64656 RepID=UPI0022FE36D1|nr:exocyst complex component Sec5-domain-containing protein [Zychaea mexicana]KAI9492453.1 exocyst complex component Sec5-domain-containing protein [Zychaea mexicana]
MINRAEVPEYAEDAAIMRFYELDTVEPEVWVDQIPLDDATVSDATLRHFSQRYDEPIKDSGSGSNDLQFADDTDPLGIRGTIFDEDTPQSATSISQLKERSALVITNKSFQPRYFLQHVHKDTTYNELISGEERLRLSVDQRAEALKHLVHSNFDRFVSAKVTVDHVYEEMKSKQLNPEEEYGTRSLEKALNEANARADQIYGPIVERRQKVEKVRSTLTVLQRYKFFFNLPSSLLESIKQHKYETAIRDYKKGKFLYNDLQKSNNIQDDDDLDGQELKLDGANISELHRKVFEKVWTEVNKIVVELRGVLLKMLADPWRSMEEQEKTINFLFDLDTTEDPAWFYLDSQYQWIVGLLKKTYETNAKKLAAHRAANETEESDIQRSLALKKGIEQVRTKSFDVNTDRDPDNRYWRITSELVKSLSALLLRCLPDFWRLSKAFIEGKFAHKASEGGRRRRQGVDLGKVEQCQSMTRNIVNVYAQLISDHFELNVRDMPVQENPDGTESVVMPAFIPVNASSIHVSEYLTRIIGDLGHCVNDISAIHLAGEAFSGLTDLIEKARWKYVDVICKCWERDAKTFYLLEEWILDPEIPQCTGLLKRYYDYHKFCARSTFRISTHVVTVDDMANQKHERPIVKPEYVERIRGSFLESTYTFLDGLVRLAFSDYTPLNEKEEVQLAKKRDKIDVHSMDMRILLTVGNLAHMRSTVIPKLVGLFKLAYKCNMDEDLKTLIEVVDQLDKILFNDYVKRKSGLIRDIIRQGILLSGIDWYSIPKPTEVHSYVYEALMTLVMVHSQVSSVTKQLVHRAISALLENMANDCLESFRQVERFGMGGMLQATLEIEFMHQTLQQYVTTAASDTLQLIYQSIEQSYDAQQQNAGELQSELNHVKDLLVFSRKSTVVQFLCFKQNKDRSRK